MEGGNMKFKWIVNRLPLTIILLSVIQLSGCGVKALPYTGKAGLDTSNMTPQKVDKAEFLLPPGWTFIMKTTDPFTDPTVRGLISPGKGHLGTLKKEGTSSNIEVFCWGTWITRDDLPDIARESLMHGMPDSKLIKGTYEIDTPGSVNPYFEVYSGTGTREGRQVPLYGYVAWKWTYGFGCKYNLIGFAGKMHGNEVEDDFIAIVRSLKN
jgi:hypothetical protein